MWQTRYDTILAALPIVFGLVKTEYCAASCNFNSSNIFFLIHFRQENLLCTYCSSANPYTCIKSPEIDRQALKDRQIDRNRLVGHPWLRASRSKGSPKTVVRIEWLAGMWSCWLNFFKNVCLNYYSRNLVSFNFRGDNASLPTSFHESQYDGWSSCVTTIVSIYSKPGGCVLRLQNRTDCDVWLYPKKLVAVHVWNAPDHWHNWRTAPPSKLNVKTGTLRSLYFYIYYSLVSVDC